MIIIDGNTYDIPVISLRRKADFLDKTAFRTDDGVLHRELIGVYFNYELQLGRTTNISEYAALWNKLTEAVPFHEVTVPDNTETYTFTAYFANVADELRRVDGAIGFWKSLTVNFIAREPAAT